ncbi:MAG TPA: TIGR03545 family protein [Gemmatimonadales bacterium]|nr:TIGR03545 family protein [Gemmatimonadales bacterium]
MKFQIFRWKAIGPLLLFLAIIGILVWIFAEPVAKDTTEEASTELLGTQVDLGKLDLFPRQAAVDLRALQIADPFVLTRNLLEADEIHLKLNPAALAEKKIVIEQLNLQGMRFGTTRKTPARPQKGDGFAPQVYRSVQEWTNQFNVPLLSLTPIDTVRQLVLNPGQLTTVREAQALTARTDSIRQAMEQGFQQLKIAATVDSARQLAERLSATDPKKLGLDGTRQAIESVRQTLKAIGDAKQRVQGLERNVNGGVQLLGQGLRSLEQARAKDFAFARSLLKLPTFAAPDIGSAFFGKVSIERFKQALYWAELAQKYMPPGLLPHPAPGPKRLRAAGSTIEFPKVKEFPRFLLEQGRLDFSIGGGSVVHGNYAATVRGLTSTPALYGRPAVVSAHRRAAGSAIAAIDVDAVINHLSARTHDSANARLQGVKLPSFDLPGVPFRVAPGIGSSSLTFSLRNGGAELSGRWAIQSNQVSWVADTGSRQLNDLERVVFRVVSGLKELQVVAEVTGSVKAPKLAVSSNLDQAVSQRLKAVVGEEVAKAERLARAKVDSLVADKVEPLKKQIASVQGEATQRIQSEKKRLDEVEAQLNAELKRLTGGLAPGIELPKIKL